MNMWLPFFALCIVYTPTRLPAHIGLNVRLLDAKPHSTRADIRVVQLSFSIVRTSLIRLLYLAISSVAIMRAISLFASMLAAVISINATFIRRDGCDGLSGTDNVSNFKLVAVHQLGDSITIPALGLIPETPSLLNSWIAVRFSSRLSEAKELKCTSVRFRMWELCST